MKKALIFGISGFAGGYLARELVSSGYEVAGSDIIPCSTEDISFIRGDILSPEAVREIINSSGVDTVINLAAVSSVGASWKMPQTTVSMNVIGSLNILEAARMQKTPPAVMLVGSSEEYGASSLPLREDFPLAPENPYGIAKMTQESFAALYRRHYGMKIFCVRPFNHTGVGQKDSFVLPGFCRQAAIAEKSGAPAVIRVGDISVKRDFSHVRDIVRAYRMILEKGSCDKVYNVGSGKAYGLEELLRYVISLTSQEITVETDPERLRPSDVPVVCCDRSLITSELGWEPEYTVFDALDELYLNYLKEIK